ncbi:hypothetical protein [Anabaena sp. CCY 9402-a]|uniref:hypothetical protein n=1 Tax=Anabaena sp. CCY 9402-a TaxID=3103867 RepID=UPI0039C5B44B
MNEIPDYHPLKIAPDQINETFDNFDIDEHIDQRIERLLSKFDTAEIQDQAIRRTRSIYFNQGNHDYNY